MATERLRLENIGFGSLMERANAHLDDICEDVIRRPHLKRPRKVVIEVAITPDYDGDAELNFPTIDWTVKPSVPGAKGMQTKALVKGGAVEVELGNVDARQPMLPGAENVVHLTARKDA